MAAMHTGQASAAASHPPHMHRCRYSNSTHTSAAVHDQHALFPRPPALSSVDALVQRLAEGWSPSAPVSHVRRRGKERGGRQCRGSGGARRSNDVGERRCTAEPRTQAAASTAGAAAATMGQRRAWASRYRQGQRRMDWVQDENRGDCCSKIQFRG